MGWTTLDPVMGIVGAIIITRWSYGLIKQTSPILLDGSIDAKYQLAIQNALEDDTDTQITDIHIWRVSAHHYAAIITIASKYPQQASYYKNIIADFDRLSHVTIEINPQPNQ
jgi:Co/Zn/Cd efflux system component